MRRFPPPWTLEALDGGGYKIVDSHGQSLAYVYGHADPRDAQVAKAHHGSDGSTIMDRAERVSYRPRVVAENVAAGLKSYSDVMRGWEKSSGHQENLLRPEVTAVGA